MNTIAYDQGFHARLYPHDAKHPGADFEEWQRGYAAADALLSQPLKPRMVAHITIERMIDMHLMDKHGIPFARLKEPVRTGEEAERILRTWWKHKQEEIQQDEEEGEDE